MLKRRLTQGTEGLGGFSTNTWTKRENSRQPIHLGKYRKAANQQTVPHTTITGELLPGVSSQEQTMPQAAREAAQSPAGGREALGPREPERKLSSFHIDTPNASCWTLRNTRHNKYLNKLLYSSFYTH